MSKYTERLDKISESHFVGASGYDRQPSGLLLAMAEMSYAKNIANGFDKTGNVSSALLKEVNKDNAKVLDAALLKKSAQTYS
ncbi:MAG: hypothetical protein E7016_07295 [Alphaproteobacteria bacterium]|nr:hypothetical protein [Alphaproteobacteria bacterium]